MTKNLMDRLACLVGGCVGTALFTSIPADPSVLNCVLVYASAEMVSDVIITGSIFWGLWKSKTGFEGTDRILRSLIRNSIEAGAPPAMW